jgi:dimethylhistidine N-methyltransferase
MRQGGVIDTRRKTIRAPFEVFDFKPEPVDVAAEVLEGLSARDKWISPKFFYDETGSKLFESITRLPEYYLTRTELDIFDRHMGDIAGSVGPGVCLVEYGSGSSLKIRKVLEEVEPAAYVPVDISGDHLVDMARALADDFPEMAIYPTCADFTNVFDLPPPVAAMPKVGFFPGSSIGNFDPLQAERFLAHVRTTLGDGARFIIGVDLKKDAEVLEAAYNDDRGITAQFNLNLISHLGALLDVDLDPDRFEHRARYDPNVGAIQMHLEVTETHDVAIAGERIRFDAGESVHTENSFKYDPDEFLRLSSSAGFVERGWWTDEQDWFAVFLLEVKPD